TRPSNRSICARSASARSTPRRNSVGPRNTSGNAHSRTARAASSTPTDSINPDNAAHGPSTTRDK
ncbi:hypothetical protein, partial [Streptomyces sp. NPDC059071]|uniref:hypothetical protein n=1 Tax=Streptomyces sp. NPDC059071 TaxID=3346714 RepID=UPI0036B9CBD8